MKSERETALIARLLAIGLLLSQSVFFPQSVTSVRADPLDSWTRIQPPTNNIGYGMQLLGVTYGNGRYVAVGQNVQNDFGFVDTSEDGVNWTLHVYPFLTPDPVVYDLYQVTYANGTFVAIGWNFFNGTNLYHSTDGSNWTAHSTLSGNVNGVTFGGGLFVAVGDGVLYSNPSGTNRQIYTSPIGVTWTARNSGSPVNDVRSIQQVAYGGGRYVALDDGGSFYTSSTGTTWTRSMTGNPNAHGPGWINFCNGHFIALPYTGTSYPGSNLVSPDGLSWSPMVKDTATPFTRVIYTNALYLALSSSSVFTSTNGTNWIQRNLQAPTNTLLTDLVLGKSNVVVVGYTATSGGTVLALPIVFTSAPFVGVSMGSGFPPQLSISGWPGRTCRIEYVNSLVPGSNNWQALATFTLTTSPLLWADSSATNSQRYYRVVLLP